MQYIDGQWYMKGLEWEDEACIHTSDELLKVIDSIGFLPLFSNEVTGFSVEEMTATQSWWSADAAVDPWEWRGVLAKTGKVAYGKFFGNKAGFISKKWFPYFANYRRAGYDFDSRYEDGKANYREKMLMDLFIPKATDMWAVKKKDLESQGCASSLYTFEMKEKGGFGKGGEKNFEGILTKLQMQTYLVVKEFRPRMNKKGEEYGWSVAVMTPPEYLWSYKSVTGQYKSDPADSYAKILMQMQKFYDADDKMIAKVLK